MGHNADDAAEQYRMREKVVGKHGWDFSHLYPREEEKTLSADEERRHRNAVTAQSLGVISEGVTTEIDLKRLKLRVDAFVRDHAQTLRDFGEQLESQKSNSARLDPQGNDNAWRRSPMTDRHAFNRKLQKFKEFLDTAVIELSTIGDSENQNVSGTALVQAWDKGKKWAELERMLRLANVEPRTQNDDLYILENKALSERVAAAYESFHSIVQMQQELKAATDLPERR